MRHQYTRAELESITQETAIYIEGAGIAQLQWGGLEIAVGRDSMWMSSRIG